MKKPPSCLPSGREAQSCRAAFIAVLSSLCLSVAVVKRLVIFFAAEGRILASGPECAPSAFSGSRRSARASRNHGVWRRKAVSPVVRRSVVAGQKGGNEKRKRFSGRLRGSFRRTFVRRPCSGEAGREKLAMSGFFIYTPLFQRAIMQLQSRAPSGPGYAGRTAFREFSFR